VAFAPQAVDGWDPVAATRAKRASAGWAFDGLHRRQVMILPLRQRHRIIFTGLALFIPLIFATGIVSRQPPLVDTEEGKGFLAEPQYEKLIWEKSDLWEKYHILTRMKSNGEGHFAIEFSNTEDLLRPDLLLYWAAADAQVSDSLPEDAILLGAAMPGIPAPINFSADFRSRSGRLILYSLANHELAAISREILPPSGP
jgi:hypothetical protein